MSTVCHCGFIFVIDSRLWFLQCWNFFLHCFKKKKFMKSSANTFVAYCRYILLHTGKRKQAGRISSVMHCYREGISLHTDTKRQAGAVTVRGLQSVSGPVGAIWDRFGPIFFKRLGVDWFTFSPFILLIQKQNTHRPLDEILCWLYCKYYTNAQILVKCVHYIHVCYSCALQAYYLQHLAINREWILWHGVFLKHFGGLGLEPHTKCWYLTTW